ncbi:DUF2057 domain-containing protein [Shewanella schlegeliana]|uniref:UPF0319 protein JMA39_19030 n=1 Tax=Shewanella schlegeliana TaxID=190308 RepID=A0ABS1T317_9GAMM|nr:DUF2057 domain-containing protein [Shewanella schlegeliana]MBL4915195.1 DUF2057 domain-containing protein [Shewanella schlegeliana]MCL1110937.1 DUF2057 domain-containing protein [Shewanella schlegeliana]GIU29533.1 UPF0319 protein [Shewanella schlegeliana]
MKRHALILSSALLLFTTSAFADVTLSMPSNSELVLVNGVDASGRDTLNLKNGINQIAFRYLGRYKQQGSQTQFQSDVIIIKFDQSNADLALSMPRIRSGSAANKFNQSPQVTLEDQDGNLVSFDLGMLIKKGLQLGRDYEAEMAAYNLTAQEASLNIQPAVISVTPTTASVAVATASTTATTPASTTTKPKASSQVNVGQMLDFWYQQADEETRKAFKKRIENQ